MALDDAKLYAFLFCRLCSQACRGASLLCVSGYWRSRMVFALKRDLTLASMNLREAVSELLCVGLSEIRNPVT
jgi:hypothetical protein